MPSDAWADALQGARPGRPHERVGVSDDVADTHDAQDQQAELDESDEPDDQGEQDEQEAAGDPLLAAPDYYALLGVGADATPDELRRAYHRLVKLWHPDRYTSAPDELRARAERRMRQLNAAYHTLSDPDDRAQYDTLREGRATPVGDVINVFGQRSAAGGMRAEPWDGHASANPNGAGQFFGALALIVALALIGGAVGGAGMGGVAALAALVGVAAVVIAVGFFVTQSPLARWANGVLEAEPRGFARAARAAQRRAEARPGASERERPADAPSHASTDASDASTDGQASEPDAQATFAALIEEALTAVPHEFDEYMRNVVVRAEEEPDAETLRRAGVPAGHTLLGLYHGVSLTRRGAGEVGPEVISIYRGPITRYCGGDLERMRRQVRATVLHELAHHFGIDHDEMPEWVK